LVVFSHVEEPENEVRTIPLLQEAQKIPKYHTLIEIDVQGLVSPSTKLNANVTVFKFTPVPMLRLKKALLRVCHREPRAAPDLVDHCVAISSGDIRNALVAFEFISISTQGKGHTINWPFERGNPKRRKTESNNDVVPVGHPQQQRDCSLDLFHALGKSFQDRDIATLITNLPVPASTFLQQFHHYLLDVLTDISVIASTLNALSLIDCESFLQYEGDSLWLPITACRQSKNPLTGQRGFLNNQTHPHYFKVLASQKTLYDPLVHERCIHCNPEYQTTINLPLKKWETDELWAIRKLAHRGTQDSCRVFGPSLPESGRLSHLSLGLTYYQESIDSSLGDEAVQRAILQFDPIEDSDEDIWPGDPEFDMELSRLEQNLAN